VVYRWRTLTTERDKEVIYIGSAEDLRQRIQRVLTPGKKGGTNTTLNKVFTEHRSQGRKTVLEVLDFEAFTVNGILFSPRTLSSYFKRLTIENLLLALAQASGQVLLNSYKLEELLRLQAHARNLPRAQQDELWKKAVSALNELVTKKQS
jgi:hypothetical protein